MGSSEEKEKFGMEKNGGILSCPSSNIPLDWRFGGGNLVFSRCLVPPENSGASSCSSISMADSFSSIVWDHPSSQNSEFCSNNFQTSSSTSKAVPPRNTDRGSLRPGGMEKVLNVDCNNPYSIPISGGFLQPGTSVLPQNLPCFPMDSAFIERAAKFSCFSDFSNMMNPFSLSGSLDPFSKAGVVHKPGLPSSSGLDVSGTQFQNGDPEMAQVLKDDVPMDHEVMDGCFRKNEETGGFFTPSDEGKCGIGAPGNGSEEADISGSGDQEELSVLENFVGEPLAKAMEVKKRKRRNQDVELEQRKGSPQLSAETAKEKIESKEDEQNLTSVANMTSRKGSKDNSQNSDAPKQDYIHVRARRGQATNSHSLAERVRREKISERMKFLQDLVPGCNRVTGKAVMLDEIINYVQSLQQQVEFLSMKLAAVNPQLDFNIEELLSKNVFQSHGCTPSGMGMLPNMGISHPQLHPFQQGLVQGAIPSTGSHSDLLRRTISSPLTTMNGYRESALQTSNAWNDELHNAVQMSFDMNGPYSTQEFNGSQLQGHMKVEP